ncbi:hypothetical protein UFOVP610_37 [uncultured Caudovirales phage]|uniref:Uncharacterized protein n=1 Tax=uncultured Caudovirales phage TaxID=2100421 RepID=A0A6J5N1J3_9CAUD|nr:hypothetical protein UFOVP610_37 [uncultured Caudovirales phage]
MSEANKANEISDKIKAMPLPDLLRMAATAIETKMAQGHVEFILIHLEIALNKRRLMKKLGKESSDQQ